MPNQADYQLRSVRTFMTLTFLKDISLILATECTDLPRIFCALWNDEEFSTVPLATDSSWAGGDGGNSLSRTWAVNAEHVYQMVCYHMQIKK